MGSRRSSDLGSGITTAWVDSTAEPSAEDPPWEEERFPQARSDSWIVLYPDGLGFESRRAGRLGTFVPYHDITHFAVTGRAIWIGAADAELKDKPSADLVRKRLDYAITQMFEKARL